MNSPQADSKALRGLVQAYSSFGNNAGLQRVADKLAALARANPDDFQAAIGFAEASRHLQKPEAAIQMLDKAFSNPKIDANSVLSIAQAYAALGAVPKLEVTLEKLTKVMPESPEAWYDLAVLKCRLGKTPESLAALRQALDLSAKRLRQDPKKNDLLASARKEENFAPLRQNPEFKKLVPAK
jgi:tetratricopeptide (TPR) repeat protein